jgi:hypothetical protein
MMRKVRGWLLQALLYGAFAAGIAVFSQWPTYEHLAPDRALIKLSLVHHGKRVQECRTLSPEELAKLPANMRAPTSCPRERSPITVEVDVDGALALREVARSSGLSSDGAASVYRRIEVNAGVSRIDVRLRDSARASGFDFESTATIALRPAQIVVIDFDAERGGITFQ